MCQSLNHRLTLGTRRPVVLLHGWGGSMQVFAGVEKHLVAAGHTVLNLDFYGFGDSPPPIPEQGIEQYVAGVADLLDQLQLTQCLVIGHSFGGRVAILLATNPRVARLLLVGSAGMRPRPSLRRRLRIWRFKLARKLGRDTSRYGSSDYLAMPPPLRAHFVTIVNTYLESALPLIRIPTLLVWGQHDDQTPLYMARRMKRAIADSALIVLPRASHYAYADSFLQFCHIATSFGSEDDDKS